MAYSTLPNSGLRMWPYGESGWLTHMNYNVQRLNDTLLYLSALLDVDVTGIANGNILKYVSGSGKWEDQTPDWPALSTTTTSSTSTSSTTTSTTAP